MPCTAVIHRHVPGTPQAALEQGVLLGVKPIVIARQYRINRPGGNVDPPLTQLLVQQRLGHLTVVVLIQDVAAQRHAKVMPGKLGGQFCAQASPLRSNPAFQAVAGVVALI